MSLELQNALDVATAAAKSAGALLLEELYREGGPRGATGHCPADSRAEQLIRDQLLAAFPGHGILGEELGGAAPVSPGGPVWVIDPNDGTSAFQRGSRGAAVSIALLVDRRPVLGVVYVYAGRCGSGDLFTWAKGCGPVLRNGAAVTANNDRPRPAALGGDVTALLSQDADGRSTANAQASAPARYRPVASIAHRLALVAAGEGEFAASIGSGGPQSWDYAAGHALVIGAGGELFNAAGEAITYAADGSGNGGGSCMGLVAPLTRDFARRDWNAILSAPRDVPAIPGMGLVRPQAGMMMRDAGRLDRACGCLLGQLAGDSLGGLVEFKDADSIRSTFPNGVRDLADGGTWHTLAGQPTDDSELALMLARSLAHVGRFDDDAVARGYAHWYMSAPFDMGGTTATALGAAARAAANGGAGRLAQSGVAEAARAAANIHSQANGALMRVSPLGIFGHASDPAAVADWARRDALLTHPHPVCQDASAVLAVTIAHAVRHGPGPRETYAFAKDFARSAGLHADVIESLASAGSAPPADFQGQMGWVRIALHNAFYQLIHAESAEAGVIDTVMRGGDTDTNAAIAGAMLGAVYGASNIPHRWTARLLTCRPIRGLAGVARPRPAEFWPVDVFELAERLAARGERLKV